MLGGGIIRDVLSGEIPLILRPEVYATAALAATVFVLLHIYLLDSKYIAGIACALTVFFNSLGNHRVGLAYTYTDLVERRKTLGIYVEVDQ